MRHLNKSRGAFAFTPTSSIRPHLTPKMMDFTSGLSLSLRKVDPLQLGRGLGCHRLSYMTECKSYDALTPHREVCHLAGVYRPAWSNAVLVSIRLNQLTYPIAPRLYLRRVKMSSEHCFYAPKTTASRGRNGPMLESYIHSRICHGSVAELSKRLDHRRVVRLRPMV